MFSIPQGLIAIRFRACTVAVAGAFLIAASAYGQLASTTSLVGNVSDSSNAMIRGASVTATNVDTRETYPARTNELGYYEITFIKNGTYRIEVNQPGFQTMQKTGIVVEANQTVRTDFVMKVGQASETVTVAASAPPVVTDEPTIRETLNQKAASDLPLNGRDSLKLATTIPGVVSGFKAPSGLPGGGEDFIGPGTREVQNSISLDGVSIMTNLINTSSIRPSIDAVQEVQVQTGTYPADYGGYMGVQINLISKNGTNTLHGSVFEFTRNNWFDARGFFNAVGQAQAPFRQNQFGFELDGPVVIPKLYNGRNKTFFMGNYEGLRNFAASASIATELTPLMRQGNFSELLRLSKPVNLRNPFDPAGAVFPGNIIPSTLLSPQGLKAIQYMPLPNLAGPTTNFAVNVPSGNNTDQTVDRVDQSIGDKIRLFFRFVWSDTSLLTSATNPFNGFNQIVDDRNLVAGYTQVLTPHAVNDLRVGRQYTTIDEVNYFASAGLADAGAQLGIPGFTSSSTNPGVPNFTITGYDAIGGAGASTPLTQEDITMQLADVFSWTHGAHSITAGAEIRKLTTNRSANNNVRGAFTFSGQYAGDGAADLLLGIPASITTPGPLYPGGAAEYRNGFFVADKWQLNQRLTVNIGLRYDLTTAPESTTGNGTILDPTDSFFIPAKVPAKIPFNNTNYLNFAPRVGFAYRARDQWVVRGGYGIYYNSNHLNDYTLTSTNPPFSTIYSYIGGTTTPTLSLGTPLPSTLPGVASYPSAFTINPNLPTQYMDQWSLDVQRGLWRGGALDVEYIGSHAVHLDRSYYNNTPLPGPGNVNARRPNQLFGSIRTIQNDETSSYEALNLVYRQQLFHGFSGLLSYTWSHDLDASSDSNNGSPMNPYNWKEDYGNANWDVRHRFVGNWVYELPWLKNTGNALIRNTLGNWQLNGITTLQTGFPFTVAISNDQANNGLGGQRPNIIGPVSPNCGQGHLANCITSNAAAAFQVPALYTFGSLGRNTFRGPDFINFDMSLFKNVRIRERATVQIRGEFFNVFNHPSFSNPTATLVTTSSGSISASSFGNITSTSNNPRQIQLGARLTF
ncbi:MAG TPA: TonB-dependent receptor [Bryobacteraceae bacterium]|jgi:outer membrane receptor protein involved in Fe transport